MPPAKPSIGPFPPLGEAMAGGTAIKKLSNNYYEVMMTHHHDDDHHDHRRRVRRVRVVRHIFLYVVSSECSIAALSQKIECP
jgi:hypothetical protein